VPAVDDKKPTLGTDGKTPGRLGQAFWRSSSSSWPTTASMQA
jgi:hypothetical protein